MAVAAMVPVQPGDAEPPTTNFPRTNVGKLVKPPCAVTDVLTCLTITFAADAVLILNVLVAITVPAALGSEYHELPFVEPSKTNLKVGEVPVLLLALTWKDRCSSKPSRLSINLPVTVAV